MALLLLAAPLVSCAVRKAAIVGDPNAGIVVQSPTSDSKLDADGNMVLTDKPVDVLVIPDSTIGGNSQLATSTTKDLKLRPGFCIFVDGTGRLVGPTRCVSRWMRLKRAFHRSQKSTLVVHR